MKSLKGDLGSPKHVCFLRFWTPRCPLNLFTSLFNPQSCISARAIATETPQPWLQISEPIKRNWTQRETGGVNNTISQRRFHQAHDESHWQWRGPSSELSADSPSQPRRSAASLSRARAGAELWRLAKMIVFVLPVYVSECAPLTCTRHLRAGRGTVSFGN